MHTGLVQARALSLLSTITAEIWLRHAFGAKAVVVGGVIWREACDAGRTVGRAACSLDARRKFLRRDLPLVFADYWF